MNIGPAIHLSKHTQDMMFDRGITFDDIVEVLEKGYIVPNKRSKEAVLFRWNGMTVVLGKNFTVITVYINTPDDEDELQAIN